MKTLFLFAAMALTANAAMACPDLSGSYKSCTVNAENPALRVNMSDVVVSQATKAGVTTYTISSVINGARGTDDVLVANGQPSSRAGDDGEAITTISSCSDNVLSVQQGEVASDGSFTVQAEYEYAKLGANELYAYIGVAGVGYATVDCK